MKMLNIMKSERENLLSLRGNLPYTCEHDGSLYGGSRQRVHKDRKGKTVQELRSQTKQSLDMIKKLTSQIN